MTNNELIAEGERLARPCLLLSPSSNSGTYVATWGGKGVLEPPAGPWRHWISVECNWLAGQDYGLSGVISVYSNDADCQTGHVSYDPSAKLPKKPQFDLADYGRKNKFNRFKDGTGGPDDKTRIALYGKPTLAFPPIEAVFEYGTGSVREWLDSLGLPKPKQWDPYFQAREAAEPYEQEYRKRCPLFDPKRQFAAMLGGWHTEWPDGGWVELNQKRLVLWTFWNSEPWLEVWLDKSGSFEVKQRIT